MSLSRRVMMSSVDPAASFEGASPSESFADIFASPLAQWMLVGADPSSIHALTTNLGINDNCGEFIALWSLAGERGAAALDHWYGTFVEPFLRAAGAEYKGPPPQGRILHLAHLWKRAFRGSEEAAKRPFLAAISSPERFARAYNPAAPPRNAVGGAGGAGGAGATPPKPTTYSCNACTMRNAMTNAKCDICETANPDYKPGVSAAAGDPVYTGPFAGPAVLEAPALASIGISFQPGGQYKMPLPPGMIADSGEVFGARGAVPWAAITDCGIEEVLPRSL
jgi:hypothetical protein